MFTDEHKTDVWKTLRQHDLRPLGHLLTDALIESAAQAAGVKVRCGPLNVVTRLWLGLLCALEAGKNFTGVLQLTLKLLHDAGKWDGQASPALLPQTQRQGRGDKPKGRRGRPKGKQPKGKQSRSSGKSKHNPHGGDPNLVSEEAFAQARKLMPLALWVSLILRLGECFEAQHGRAVRWKGYRLLALDGTTIDLPGWRALKNHFGTASNHNGPGKTPKARMVMLQLPLARLPWRYQLTPLKEGERTVAGRLLGQLQANDLVLMDRGFFSYGLFWQVQHAGAFFAVRLMKGVLPRHLKHLGRKDRLVSWGPTRRDKGDGLPRSMTLRLIDYQIPGFRPSAILTNQTDPGAISRMEWVRLATQSDPGRRLDPGLYHRRWEIETTFWELKVEQKMEGGLRGRTVECIEYEVAGHVVLYLLVRWLMVQAALAAGKDPLRLSFLEALRELHDLRPLLTIAEAAHAARYLLPLLIQRLADHVVPWRPGRYDPRKGDTKVKYKGKGKYRLPSRLAARET
jgi:hypothetical protein